MLYIDVPKACSNKGIDDARRWLVKNGLSHPAAYRLLNHKQESINFNTLERLCLSLNCTPNEFFSWQPSDAAIPASHPMQKLKPVAAEHSVNARLKTLSPEKMEELQKFLDQLTGQ
ncbi:MAG TPA: helix-turn-helix transcriptional regulator [Panacibacter sp.]|nr:helix-turn-helix transcriptional regulator [Panacibacter sp.]